MLLVLDVNETLLDMSPLDEVLGEYRPWFDQMIRAALVTTAAGRYVGLARLGADAARQRLGIAPGADDPRLARLTELLAALPAHADALDALHRARAAGDRVVVLGNSTLDTLKTQLAAAGLRPVVDAVYSADDATMLKPSPLAYRMVLRAEGVAPAEAMMVAAHDWDVAGASYVGMRTALVRRRPVEPLAGHRPDVVADDLLAALSSR